ncbi:MAG TPA: NAD(P)-dependent oxidoreductase [Bryobacteraceae bacterium]|jgi:3-hydroxyisobutyrate dehydrogenase-like beta-hydroxyacid dehydrogenase|nr:NAD(P)-dependent oxidoreductase [Bryobacteraceae bacterium]
MNSPTQPGTIGIVGLGNMGKGVARRLLDGDYPVIVFSRTSAKAQRMVQYGALASPSLRDLAGRVDFLISFLPDEAAVRDVYYGPAGVLANAAAGLHIIEMSTVLPETARELYRAGATRGIPVLDAPVSGSTPAVEQGALTVLAGGDADAFAACIPIFSQIARKWFLLGPSGSGAAMKLVVNTLLGVGMQAIAEAVTLGENLGLARERLIDVLGQTSVVAPAHAGKLAQALHQDYYPQFPLRLMIKDFGLILNEAAKRGIPMPATSAARRVSLAEAADGGEEDFSAIIRYMERLAQVPEPEFPTAA